MFLIAGLIGQDTLSKLQIDLLLSREVMQTDRIETPILNWGGRTQISVHQVAWSSREVAPIHLLTEEMTTAAQRVHCNRQDKVQIGKGAFGCSGR